MSVAAYMAEKCSNIAFAVFDNKRSAPSDPDTVAACCPAECPFSRFELQFHNANVLPRRLVGRLVLCEFSAPLIGERNRTFTTSCGRCNPECKEKKWTDKAYGKTRRQYCELFFHSYNISSTVRIIPGSACTSTCCPRRRI